MKNFKIGDKVLLKNELQKQEPIVDGVRILTCMKTDKVLTISGFIKDEKGENFGCTVNENSYIYPLSSLNPVGKKIDKEKIEKHFKEILIALGEDPDREGLQETPKRVAKAYGEIFEGLQYTNEQIAEMYDKGFTDEDIKSGISGFGEFVLIKNIRCYSCCEHHFLPEILDIHIAYIPNKKVLGLSKIPRIAKMVCKRPQLQERIAKDIYDVLNKITQSEDIAVIISGRHMCMEMRGVNETGSKTDTALFMGKFKENYGLRQELLKCIDRG